MDPASESPFPLPSPLRLYESFMLLDENPRYPMTYTLELRLSGRLERGALEEAWRETLAWHPLLTARVERSRWRRSVWVPAEAPPALHWHAMTDAARLRPGPIDIAAEPGLRLWALDDPREPRLWFQFHHVATDGIGGMQFIGDLLARYSLLTTPPGGTPPVPAPIAIERLHERETLWPEPSFRRRLLSTTARRLWNLSASRPRPLAAGRGDPGANVSSQPEAAAPQFPTYHTRVLDRTALGALRQAAARRMASLNDLTTLAFFRALKDWNREHDFGAPETCLRVSLPVSLRCPQHDDSPAANQLSLMMLTRSERELDDEAASLRHFRHATEVCSASVEGRLFTFWGGGLAARLPWLFRLGGGRGCFCTGILANIGRVRRHLRGRFPEDDGRIVAGSVRLDALLGAACVRQGARVAASFGTYADQLFLNMNCDPLYINAADASRLIDRVMRHLTAFGDLPPAPNGATRTRESL